MQAPAREHLVDGGALATILSTGSIKVGVVADGTYAARSCTGGAACKLLNASLELIGASYRTIDAAVPLEPTFQDFDSLVDGYEALRARTIHVLVGAVSPTHRNMAQNITFGCQFSRTSLQVAFYSERQDDVAELFPDVAAEDAFSVLDALVAAGAPASTHGLCCERSTWCEEFLDYFPNATAQLVYVRLFDAFDPNVDVTGACLGRFVAGEAAAGSSGLLSAAWPNYSAPLEPVASAALAQGPYSVRDQLFHSWVAFAFPSDVPTSDELAKAGNEQLATVLGAGFLDWAANATSARHPEIATFQDTMEANFGIADATPFEQAYAIGYYVPFAARTPLGRFERAVLAHRLLAYVPGHAAEDTGFVNTNSSGLDEMIVRAACVGASDFYGREMVPVFLDDADLAPGAGVMAASDRVALLTDSSLLLRFDALFDSLSISPERLQSALFGAEYLRTALVAAFAPGGYCFDAAGGAACAGRTNVYDSFGTIIDFILTDARLCGVEGSSALTVAQGLFESFGGALEVADGCSFAALGDAVAALAAGACDICFGENFEVLGQAARGADIVLKYTDASETALTQLSQEWLVAPAYRHDDSTGYVARDVDEVALVTSAVAIAVSLLGAALFVLSFVARPNDEGAKNLFSLSRQPMNPMLRIVYKKPLAPRARPAYTVLHEAQSSETSDWMALGW